MTTIINVRNLSRSFRKKSNPSAWGSLFRPMWTRKDAVTDISFRIKAGESVAFLGPNGAGKTTTTKMLTGLVYPTGGTVKILGYRPQDRKHDFLMSIGLVMGNKSGLNWDLTARQSFELLYKIYDVDSSDNHARVYGLCDMLNVSHVLDTQIRRLSLGERMKLELVGSLLHDPKVLFLDEPTIGLDITSKKTVREFLRYLHSQGKTLVLTSHDMDDIAQVCDRALIINNGSIVYDGQMKELVDTYDATRIVRVETEDVVSKFTDRLDIGELAATGDGWLKVEVQKNDVMKFVSYIGEKYKVSDITIEQVALETIIEDVFKRPSP